MRNSIKKCLGLLVLTTVYFVSGAQEDSTENRGFKKEKLFTGGSVSLSFGTGSFLVGVNPVLGYSLTDWADAGIAVNYTYASQRLYYGNTNVYDNLRSRLRVAVFLPVCFLCVFCLRRYRWNIILSVTNTSSKTGRLQIK
jgi:hypothetical protein